MPVITTRVTSGCSSHSHRSRARVATIRPTATISAQPKCSDGIAANWFDNRSSPGGPYTDGPNTRAVSTRPAAASMRGGASGNTRCSTSAAPVTAASTRRAQT